MWTYLYRGHGDPFWRLNVVPHTQAVSVLSYQHIASWDPLHVGAEVEDHCLRAAFNIVQMQLKEEGAERTVTWGWVVSLEIDHFPNGEMC